MANEPKSILNWLAERGMSEYGALFARERIDLDVLPKLTDQDLKDLGIALGDRRKLLTWSAELDGSGVAPSARSKPEVMASAELATERRQVTVLFSDLVDSTGLSRRLDPEDLRGVIRAYQEAVTKIVKQYDGFVAGFRGDGVLVYFGYPTAHEDDVERAVRAALELVPAVGALHSAEPLKTRVGIATGLVVVGDLIGSGDTSERNMVGDTPNLAARLLSLAEPNSVVLADEAREMLGDFFDFEDLGARHVKGLEQAVRSWAVMKPRTVESRFDAMHGAALTELSGREEELQILLKRWQKAKTGEGQVVLISGEPGIGKSRLTAALMVAIGEEPHTRLRYFCSPQHTDSAFYPVINHMERLAGFAHGDDAEAKLGKLDAMLTQNSATEHDRSLIAALLSLPIDCYSALDYDAAQRRVKTMEALHAQLAAVARAGPVLQITEDAHWIDPTTLEALGRNVERLKGMPILHVITYRPEFVAPWVGESHVTTINLNRLGNREAAQIVASLAGNKVIPAEVIADIVDRSDGIPLFLEEMTKAVLEAESEGDARRAIKAVPSQKSAVPASLHASLMARLDRLGAAKGIAQVGAAIGRSFSHALLASVARESEAELSTLLDRLVASGLLFRQGQPPDATYLFKHALIRDAAYSMLLREPRRALHARILEALETKFPDIAENQPEVLANHATEAGQTEKAVDHLRKAGERSLARSAFTESFAQLTQAQRLLDTLPDTAGTRRQKIAVQHHLITAVTQLKGWADTATKAACEAMVHFIEQAESAGDKMPDPWQPFASILGMFAFYLVAYDRTNEKVWADRLCDFAYRHGDTLQQSMAENCMGQSNYFTGDIAQSKVSYDRSLELYSVEEHRPHVALHSQDSRVVSLALRSWSLWMLGSPDAARTGSLQAMAEAREMGHVGSMMQAYQGMQWSHIIWTRDYVSAREVIDEFQKLAERHSAAFWKAQALIVTGAYHTETGEPEKGLNLIETGTAQWQALGATIGLPHFMQLLGTANARLGKFTHAWQHIDAALSMSVTGQRYYEAGVLQAAGEIALLPPDPDLAKAEHYFQRGLEFCRERCLKGVELRLSLLLARLWRSQGKTRKAYDLLSPVYNWFTEGFDWTDMKQAKALLDEMRADLKLN